MANPEYDHDYGLIGPGDWAKLSAGDQAYLRAGSPDLSRHPDPVIQRMSSGDHFSPVQFSDQLGAAAHSRDETPAVHRSPMTWFGRDESGRPGSEVAQDV